MSIFNKLIAYSCFQDMSDDYNAPLLSMSQLDGNFNGEPSSVEGELKNVKSKRDARPYQRAVKVRNGF